MAATPSVKITKSFTYQGTTQLWTNRYHFDGGVPADDSAWLALANAITAAEKLILPATVTITKADGYAAGSDLPLWSHVYSLAGTYTLAGSERQMPGDVATFIRYSTAARTSKNHPVYLYSWYHARTNSSSDPADTIAGPMYSAMQTYGAAWQAGFSDGSVTHHRAGPNGAVATGHLTDSLLRHRDFPR